MEKWQLRHDSFHSVLCGTMKLSRQKNNLPGRIVLARRRVEIILNIKNLGALQAGEWL